ncbi:hypothetical protein [Haloferula sargassicola]|uniref:Uncharacterized protein n=1 Tax=Haloferula sargassicola TaxID=490096 RepID=A0ABP9UKG4_9BACT
MKTSPAFGRLFGFRTAITRQEAATILRTERRFRLFGISALRRLEPGEYQIGGQFHLSTRPL